MSIVNEFLTEDLPKNHLVSVKVSDNVNALLKAVYEYRKEKGLSKDYSEFIRQALTAALLLDNPIKYLPQLEMQDLSEVVNAIREQNDIQETEVKNTEVNDTENE